MLLTAKTELPFFVIPYHLCRQKIGLPGRIPCLKVHMLKFLCVGDTIGTKAQKIYRQMVT